MRKVFKVLVFDFFVYFFLEILNFFILDRFSNFLILIVGFIIYIKIIYKINLFVILIIKIIYFILNVVLKDK